MASFVNCAAVAGAHEQHAVIAGPAPCDFCRFRERCAVELLACERFSGYASGEPEWRWRRFPMAPSRARFEAVFDQRTAKVRDVRRDPTRGQAGAALIAAAMASQSYVMK